MLIYKTESVFSNRFVHNDHEIRMSYVSPKHGEIVQVIYCSLAVYRHEIAESYS